MRGMLIFRKSAKLVTSVVIAGQILALNPDGSIYAKLTGSYAPFTVEAAELEQLAASGVVTCLQNPANNPQPVFTANPDGTYSLTMYPGTLVEFGLFNTSGGVPTPLQGSTFAELAPAPGNNSVYINATGTGTQQVQLQNMVNGVPVGNVITLNLTVVAPGMDIQVATQPVTQVGVHPGVANGFYSYADDHKIVSTDGNLELNLDRMTWHATTTQPAPVMYYAADGVLTVECYQCQAIEIPAVNHLAGYDLGPYQYKNCVLIAGQSQGKKGEIIEYHSVYNPMISWTDPASESPTTKLPIRVITLGSGTSNGAQDITPTDFGAIYVTKK